MSDLLSSARLALPPNAKMPVSTRRALFANHGALWASLTDEEPQAIFSDICDEILQAALVSTIALSTNESQAYRVSGSSPSFSRPKAKNRARKEVTQLEQRQYRHQFWKQK